MKVIILRGISGSGKSTWAKQNAPHDAVIVSADHFFIQPNGEYVFDPSKLHDAHIDCFRRFLDGIEKKTPTIIVDNTNIHRWEFQPYLLAAQARGYELELITFRCDPEVAITRKQWVSPGRVRKMARDLEQQERFFPADVKKMHRIIDTNTPL